MKRNIILNCAAAGALLLATASISSAATVVDQVNDSNSFVGFNTTLNWQQEVVAGVSGILDTIELNFGIGGGSIDVFVNLGSGWQTDADDFSTSVSGLSGYSSIDVSSADISLSKGDTFIIGVRNGAGGDLRGSSGDTYAPGGLFLNGSAYIADFDLNFRTTVAAVPLPAKALQRRRS
ncbi:MAG: hypothetical protein AAFV38_13105 [Pseudomonadota bacterium]